MAKNTALSANSSIIRRPCRPCSGAMAADNRSVNGQTEEYSAPYKLKIKRADIHRLNNIVKLDVELTDTCFNKTLDKVNELSDKASDVIDTVFWAAPGDVVVLDGLTCNEENTTTSGILGTTGALSPLTPLASGADKFSANLPETIIFMAATVIDPSAENQPYSAFIKQLRRKMQEATEADTTVNDDSQS